MNLNAQVRCLSFFYTLLALKARQNAAGTIFSPWPMNQSYTRITQKNLKSSIIFCFLHQRLPSQFAYCYSYWQLILWLVWHRNFTLNYYPKYFIWWNILECLAISEKMLKQFYRLCTFLICVPCKNSYFCTFNSLFLFYLM